MERMRHKSLESKDIGVRELSMKSFSAEEDSNEFQCQECFESMYEGETMARFSFKSFDVSEPETVEEESWVLCISCGRMAAAVLLGKL